MKYFAASAIVDATSTFNYGFLTSGDEGGNLGAWTSDRLNGAIGFRNGDGEYGYMLITWVAASKTLTFLGDGAFDDTPGVGITVVPEPSEYAAALGLGALGLAYYRRRPGNKTRTKK